MDAVSLTEDEKYELICTTAAVLHLGNIEFSEAGTEVAQPHSRECESRRIRKREKLFLALKGYETWNQFSHTGKDSMCIQVHTSYTL